MLQSSLHELVCQTPAKWTSSLIIPTSILGFLSKLWNLKNIYRYLHIYINSRISLAFKKTKTSHHHIRISQISMPHTLPPSWSEVNVPVGTGSLERWQDTHRSYTYHLQLMNIFGLFKGRVMVLFSWDWRILMDFMFDPMLLVSQKEMFFICNVRIWSWTCQKDEKSKIAKAQRQFFRTCS